jgi:hypothetical protein
MEPSIQFETSSGVVSIEPLQIHLRAGLPESVALLGLGTLLAGVTDHGNGYKWLRCRGLTLFDRPCGLAICFHREALTELHFGVALPDAVLEGGWPTRSTIDKEVAFMRAQLGTVFSRSFSKGEEAFDWGVVWSCFDPKGFSASTGLRYAA